MKNCFEGKEVPEVLPEIEYIDVSNEEYEKIQDMFKYQPERLSEKTSKEEAIV